MAQPLEVDVVRENASLLGPFLIGLGALAAAVITALTANWRHQRQLTHDRELHKRQLEQDRSLREEELEHDRRMRHRETVRVVLDEVLAAERELRWAANDFFDSVNEAEANEIDSEVGEESADKGRLDQILKPVVQARMELHKHLTEAHYGSVKLRIRMGNEALVDAHEAIADSIEERLAPIDTDKWPMRTTEEKEADRQLEERIDDAQTKFLVACARWHVS